MYAKREATGRGRRAVAGVGLRCVPVLFLALVIGTGTASGHKPIAIAENHPSREEALPIENLDVSQVAYVELTEAEPEFWMRFELREPMDLYISLGVPVIERLSTYRPRIALLGPGDENPTPEWIFETSGVESPRRFHEPFTGTDSWILLEETISLSAPGVYHLVASAPPEQADKLWVAVGQREAFGLGDLLALPSIVRRVRAFHEVGPEPPSRREWAGLIAVGLIGALLAFVVLGASR